MAKYAIEKVLPDLLDMQAAALELVQPMMTASIDILAVHKLCQTIRMRFDHEGKNSEIVPWNPLGDANILRRLEEIKHIELTPSRRHQYQQNFV